MFFCDNSIIQKIRLSFTDITCAYFQSDRPALAGRRAGPVQEQRRSDIGDAGCLMLDAGYSIRDADRLMLVSGYWTLDDNKFVLIGILF